MEELGLGSSCDLKQNNPQELKVLIERCIKYLVHACRCRDANCRLANCQKIKRVVQHTKGCQQKTNVGCPICKHLILVCCYHAKHCQKTKCPVPFCDKVKNKLKQQKSQRRIANMQNSWMPSAVLQINLENSNSSSQPSPVTQPHSLPHPPQPAQQAQAQKAMSQMMSGVPNLMFNMSNAASWESSGYGRNPPQPAPQMGLRQYSGSGNILNSVGSSAVGSPQVMPNPNPSLGAMQGPAWKQLLQTLKSPPSPQQQRQVFTIMKSNPQLIAAFVKHRIAQQQLRGGPGNILSSVGNSAVRSPRVMSNPVPSLGAMEGPAWRQLIQALKFPPSVQQQQQVLTIMKSNPHLIAAFIKQRIAQQQLTGGLGNILNSVGNSVVGSPQVMSNPGHSLGAMQEPAYVQLLQILNSPPSARRQQQVLTIMKSNPQLIAAFIKYITAQEQHNSSAESPQVMPNAAPSLAAIHSLWADLEISSIQLRIEQLDLK